MDLPGVIEGLDFLDPTARRAILGETARRLFGLSETLCPAAAAS